MAAFDTLSVSDSPVVHLRLDCVVTLGSCLKELQ